MNYLAHAYLSFMHEDILVGNLISDFVKGKKKFDYTEGVQKGIALHRAIDNFTDEHSITRQAKQYLKPAVGSYSGAFIDVVYDHFLAKEIASGQQLSLEEFSLKVYDMLYNRYNVLPMGFQQMLPYMKAHNWLYNYQFEWGIERSFAGIVRRALYLESADEGFNLFQQNYDVLAELSQQFIPAVKVFAEEEFNLLLKG